MDKFWTSYMQLGSVKRIKVKLKDSSRHAINITSSFLKTASAGNLRYCTKLKIKYLNKNGWV